MAKKVSAQMEKGRRVWTWFDTGALGMAPLIGTIIQAGPKAAIIEWESGLRNRLSWERVYFNCFEYNGEFDE